MLSEDTLTRVRTGSTLLSSYGQPDTQTSLGTTLGRRKLGLLDPEIGPPYLMVGERFRCVHSLRNGAHLFWPSPVGLSLVCLMSLWFHLSVTLGHFRLLPDQRHVPQRLPISDIIILFDLPPQMLECPFQSQ